MASFNGTAVTTVAPNNWNHSNGSEGLFPGNMSGCREGSGVTGSPEPEFYPTLKQPVHMIIILSVAYSVVFLLGIIGNSLVVSLVYRNPRMHTVTNYFIVNLAIADILVCLFCLPITLLSNIFTGECDRLR